MQTRRIRCQVRPGLFPEEYIVSFRALADGAERVVEVVSDANGVRVSKPPTRTESVEGTLDVWLLGYSSGAVRVVVPGSGASDSRIVSVPEALVSV